VSLVILVSTQTRLGQAILEKRGRLENLDYHHWVHRVAMVIKENEEEMVSQPICRKFVSINRVFNIYS
jgi:hypothetical protein